MRKSSPCGVQTIFLFSKVASLLLPNFPLFVGLRPVRRTDKQSEGTNDPIDQLAYQNDQDSYGVSNARYH